MQDRHGGRGRREGDVAVPELAAEGLRVVGLLDHLKDRRVFGDGVDERVHVRVPERLTDTNMVGHRELVLSRHDEDVVLVEQILQRAEFDVAGVGQADAVDARRATQRAA